MTRKPQSSVAVPDEVVLNRIPVVRGMKVMVDTNLAELYGVTTKRMNEQVRRNISRFPDDFMFLLTEDEKQDVIKRYPHLDRLKFSPFLPNVFTEHGAVMLASVLNSEQAIVANVQIVRVFVRMREMFLTHRDLLAQLEEVRKSVTDHDGQLNLTFEYLRQFEQAKQQDADNRERRPIGYRRNGES